MLSSARSVQLLQSFGLLNKALRSAWLPWLLAGCLCAANVQAQELPGLLPEPAPIPPGLETVEFYSPAVARTMKFDIVLPEGYAGSEERYPVLYLLHGFMQNYTIWGRNLAAAFYARNVEGLILVLPDGGNSWFVNYARSAATLRAGIERAPPPRDPERQAQIDAADAFISTIVAIPGFSTQDERTPKGRDILTAEQAAAYDPFTIIYNVPRSQMPHLYMDAGTEDGLIAEARELAQLLMVNNVPFDYMQSRGRHNSEYWRRSIGHMLTIQHEVMQRALGNRP